MSLKERLIDLRLKAGLNQSELAKLCGIAACTIWELETGRRTYTKHLTKIADNLGTTPQYLLRGEVPVQAYLTNSYGSGYIGKAVRVIPVVGWKEAITWIEDNMSLTPERETIPIFDKKASADSFALQIKDNSMVCYNPGVYSFNLGDMVIVDPHRQAKIGSYLLIAVPDNPESIVRQFMEIEGYRCLVALNPSPSYPSIPMDEKVKVLGVVIGLLHSFS